VVFYQEEGCFSKSVGVIIVKNHSMVSPIALFLCALSLSGPFATGG
jgi:hypothetical protein